MFYSTRNLFCAVVICWLGIVLGTPTGQCALKPCKNGVCTNLSIGSLIGSIIGPLIGSLDIGSLGKGYMCKCNPGWTGFNCEKAYCKDTSCDKFDCIAIPNGRFCRCITVLFGKSPKYSKPDCDIDYCSSNPCKNGTCINGKDGYNCSCNKGWTGSTCSTYATDNISDGGQKTPLLSDRGPDKYCDPNPCVNGVCTIGDNGFTCACSTGYTGSTCDTRNYCDPYPCGNGTCTSGDNGYTCNYCDPNPCGSSTCINGGSGYTCNYCDPNPCGNATCINGANGYTCDYCNPNPCKVGTDIFSCSQNGKGHSCNFCLPNNCVHGGTCCSEASDYSCSCPFAWTGKNCADESEGDF